VIDVELIPQVAERFRALADAGRLSLLAALQRGELSVSELTQATGRTQPNVSQHLANLSHAGLVRARRQGTRAFYRIADPTILRICDAVCAGLVAQTRAPRTKAAALRLREPRRTGGGK
jgi:DNA-binding transcriptional ArsR family regulator